MVMAIRGILPSGEIRHIGEYDPLRDAYWSGQGWLRRDEWQDYSRISNQQAIMNKMAAPPPEYFPAKQKDPEPNPVLLLLPRR